MAAHQPGCAPDDCEDPSARSLASAGWEVFERNKCASYDTMEAGRKESPKIHVHVCGRESCNSICADAVELCPVFYLSDLYVRLMAYMEEQMN